MFILDKGTTRHNPIVTISWPQANSASMLTSPVGCYITSVEHFHGCMHARMLLVKVICVCWGLTFLIREETFLALLLVGRVLETLLATLNIF